MQHKTPPHKLSLFIKDLFIGPCHTLTTQTMGSLQKNKNKNTQLAAE